ncbi:Cyclic nucleotide-binding-like [Phytophthora cactorum]|nr:Cyclic nucleotide-binding-like [Phytophthora cactorum]
MSTKSTVNMTSPPPNQQLHVPPATQSTNPIYVYTKFVVASARATTAVAAAMMANSNSSGVSELKALHNSANALTSPRERSRHSTPRDRTHAYASLVDIVRPRTVPVLSSRQASTSPRGSTVQKDGKLPRVRKQSEQGESSSDARTSRDQDNQESRPRTTPAPTTTAPLTGDREVFPAWIRERKDFQVFFPRFSDHVITDEEILQQGVPKEPSERNIVELQCIARWIMKIPSMSTFLDLNQATEIAKLASTGPFVHRNTSSAKATSATRLENATRGADVQAASPPGTGNSSSSPGASTPNSSLPAIGCEVLMIMAEDYHKTLARCQTRRRKHLVNWLHTEVTLFRDCVESKLHFFELVSIDVPLKKGEVLYTQGESVGAFYIVRSGRVRLEVDIQYERRHRWPCDKHKWKQQVHAVRSRVPFHTEESAGFFGFEMFIKGQQTRAYTVVADSPTVELIALNRVDCFSPYFSFTPRAQDRIHDKNDKCRDMALRMVQQQLRAFRKSQSAAAANKNTPNHPPVVVQRKFPHSHETPEFQFPRLRPAKWKADNEVVSALQQACQ